MSKDKTSKAAQAGIVASSAVEKEEVIDGAVGNAEPAEGQVLDATHDAPEVDAAAEEAEPPNDADLAAATASDYVASNNVAIKHDISLAEYAAAEESEAFKHDLVVVSISHPQATDGDIYQGRFAGIRLVKGDIGRVLSNGDGAAVPDSEE